MIVFADRQMHPGGMKLNIKPHLDRLGMTQTELAEAMDVNRSFVSDIINGKKRPSMEKLELLIRALGVRPADVIIDAGTEDVNSKPVQGFEEGAAQTYTFPKAYLAQDIMRYVAPNARHPAAFLVVRPEPAFALLAGDVVIVDLNGTAHDDDIVLITRISDDGSAVTHFRRLITPWLISGDVRTASDKVDDPTGQVAIMGIVAGVLRGAGL
jgi:transcriptional regulator with XRE-family HTH domain